MSPIRSSLLLGAGDAAGGFQVSRSLRFNSADSAYLNRTPSVAGNLKTWTWSGWVKRSALGSIQLLFGTADASFYNGTYSFLSNDDTLRVEQYGSSLTWRINTTQVFRDTAAWFHLQIACDTTQSTASNRVQIYVNGTLVTTLSTTNYPTQNLDTLLNTTAAHGIGRAGTYNNYYFSGYLANVQFIDGQALTPSSFTEVSATTGQLIPKAYSGTYGTNGFYLNFADNSSNTASTLGKDTSGNGNNWTPNNLSVTAGNGNFARYVYAGNATYNGSETGTSYYTGAGSQYNGFDGNTSTYVGGQNVGASWVYFRPGTAISGVSQVRVYTAYVEQIYINGSLVSLSPSAPSATAQWYSVTSPASTINEIAIQGRVSDNSAGRFSAIEINGVVLVDNSFGSGNDSLVDTPTSYGTDTGVGGSVRGNYCTWNPLNAQLGAGSVSNGNLDFTGPSGSANYNFIGGTFAIDTSSTSGWYFEFAQTTYGNGAMVSLLDTGFQASALSNQSAIGYSGTNSTAGISYANEGSIHNYGSTTSGLTSWTSSGDIISIAIKNNKIWFAKNGTWISGSPSAETSPSITLASTKYVTPAAGGINSSVISLNTGQRPFAYTAPSGFKALCDTNLPTPLVAKSNEVFDAVLYSGNNSTQSITSLAFSPDLVWSKGRNAARSHRLSDAVRGSTKDLYPDVTSAEGSDGSITAFTATGFNLDNSTGSQYNVSGETYVSWCWKGIGNPSTSSTTINANAYSAGVPSITSQVRANATAGFSVVTYTGNGISGATVGHGLNVAPSMLIVKKRSSAGSWEVYFKDLGPSYYLELERTNAKGGPYSGLWNDTAPTATVFSIGNDGGVNANGSTYVCYAWAPVSGYSAMGSYVSNSNSDGPFIWTGFRSRFLMIKNTTDTTYSAYNGWFMVDTARTPANVPPGNANALYANKSQVENTDGAGAYSPQLAVDILANGFKLRCANTEINYNATYIYFAVAENPFQYARAR